MSAAMTVSKATKRAPVSMNGVDTPALFATINAVAAQPELAKFQFRAKSRWLSGTHSESTMHGFFGAGVEQTHVAPYTAEGDHPAVLTGADAAPSPVEWVLHALASCLTAGIGAIAAARGSDSAASSRRSKATSTCAASSDSRARSATAIRASRSPSRSTATPALMNSRKSSCSRRPGRPYSTSSPMAFRSRSPSRRRPSLSPPDCPALTGRPLQPRRGTRHHAYD